MKLIDSLTYVCLFQGFAAVVCLWPDQRIGACGDPQLWWHPSMNTLAGPYLEVRDLQSSIKLE
jgi:hypothetical protein